MVHAIARFEETLTTPSPFDRYLSGDLQAISADAAAGYAKFKAYGCSACHQGINVGGNLYQLFGAVQNVDIDSFKVAGAVPVIIRIAIGVVALALCVLIAIKPSINTGFHGKYLDNLNALDALAGSLVRNHLLVRHGQVIHYDYRESDLQKMEKFARLSMLTPSHAGQQFNEAATRISTEYIGQLDSIRANVELSKRAIGLLNNSRSALKLVMQELNRELVGEAGTAANAEVLTMAIQLNEAIAEEASAAQTNVLLNYLAAFDSLNPVLVAQIRMHTGIIARYAEPLNVASKALYHASSRKCAQQDRGSDLRDPKCSKSLQSDT